MRTVLRVETLQQYSWARSTRTSYILSSLSTDSKALEEMIDSFEFTK
jgi:hypothetical protein